MFNLLTESEKSVLKKEYAWRRAIIYLLGLVGVVFISLGLLVPVFVVSYYKQSSARSQYDSIVHGKVTSEQSYISDIKRANSLLAILKDNRVISNKDLLAKLIDARPKGITLTSIGYALKDPGVVIQLQGVAADRDALRTYTKALSETKDFSVEDLPISEYVRDTQISFSIPITLKK